MQILNRIYATFSAELLHLKNTLPQIIHICFSVVERSSCLLGYRDACHHSGVADQAVIFRVDHREEQAPDRGVARLACGCRLSWLLVRC